jgi:ERCC4-type nuclease
VGDESVGLGHRLGGNVSDTFKRGSIATDLTPRLPHPAPEPLVILVDRREQDPYTFPPFVGRERRPVVTKAATIRTGDYVSEPLLGLVAVERKSPQDFMSTITHDRDRWEAEVQRFRELERVCVVVEASLDECLASSGARWESVAGTIASLDVKHRCAVHFAGSRLLAAFFVASWLRRAEAELLPRASHIERLVAAYDGRAGKPRRRRTHRIARWEQAELERLGLT